MTWSVRMITRLDKSDWLNEIYPDRDGFREIAERMYRQIELRFPALKRR